jgi:hypothetical protein
MRRRLALVFVLAAAGALPAAAEAARTVPYDVTVRVELRDEWTFLEHAENECLDGVCIAEEQAAGRTRIQLSTPTPQRVMVIRGGRPSINGELRLKGSSLQSGTHAFTWSGAWDAANPDYELSTDDCGNRNIRTTFGLSFTKRNRVAPSLLIDDLREDCPIGMPHHEVWDGDRVPFMPEVIASVQQTKFGRTKQFTVRASRTWHADAEPGNEFVHRSGARDVRYLWEATFKRRKRP